MPFWSVILSYIQTYHSHFIREGVAETSQILLRVAHFLPKLLSCEEYCIRKSGKPIAVWSQSISGVSAVSFSRLLQHPWTEKRVAILYFVPDTTLDLELYTTS
jgi:hypothetical protein